MNAWTLLIIILVVVLVGAAPGWQHTANWGVAPFGTVGLVLLVLVVLLLLGKL